MGHDIKPETDRVRESESDVAPRPAEPTTEIANGHGAIPVAAGKSASDQGFGAHKVDKSLDTGMHEIDEYRSACMASGETPKWDDKYARGHTAARGWSQPYEGRHLLSWSLKHNTSASQAVKDFIKGPTIADYRVISVALELDELRDDLGDKQFDELFGSANPDHDATIPGGQRLQITADMYTIPFVNQMKEIAAKKAAPKQQDLDQPKPAIAKEAVEDKQTNDEIDAS